MADQANFVQAQKFRLSGSGCTSSATSITITSFNLSSGTAITTAMFGAIGYMTLEPGTSKEENISFTTVTANGDGTSTISGVTRGLNFVTPYTNSSALQQAHAGGAICVLSNSAPFYNNLTSKDNDETINGIYTFAQFPVKSGTTTPTSADQVATKAYVDSVVAGTAIYDQNIVSATAGEALSAGNIVYFKTSDQKWYKTDSDAAATCVAVKLGVAQGTIALNGTGNILIGGLDKTQTGLTAGTAYYVSGTAGALSSTKGTFQRFVGIAVSTTNLYFGADSDLESIKLDNQQIYAADSVGTDAYAITLPVSPGAYVNGIHFFFKAGTVNTGAATLNVNSLGAKTIVKNFDQTLADNDIKVGQIVHVVYNATADNFQMHSQIGNSPAAVRFGGTGADGALALTSGATNIDAGGARILVKNYTSISITGTGSLTFSNPHAQGTTVILRSQSAVTLTSSTAPMLTVVGMGPAAGAGGTGANSNGANTVGTTAGVDGTANVEVLDTSSHEGATAGTTSNGTQTGGAGGTTKGIALDLNTREASLYSNSAERLIKVRALNIVPGSAGAGGGGGGGARDGVGGAGGNGGAGGRGGGALIIECAGAWNFTTASGISVAGSVGTVGAVSTVGSGGGGGGGGGSGGWLLALYNTLTANSGSVTITGGAGGAGGAAGGVASVTGAGGGGGGQGGGHYAGAGTNGDNGAAGSGTAGGAGGAGGAGASGFSLITPNTIFS